METINHFQCFDYMIDCANNTLDEEFIKTTHKILKTNTLFPLTVMVEVLHQIKL